MWVAVLQAVVAALAGAVTDYILANRRDWDLVEKGRNESLKERIDTHVKINKEMAAIRHKLRTDPEYRRMLRETFRSSE